jgi:dihydropyrimidinase
MDIVIKNGTIATGTEFFKADLGIRDGKIWGIAPTIDKSASEVIDASGKYVIPGGVDVHTHLQLPFMGSVSADCFETGSRAAACGGTTTFIDFAIQGKGQTPFEAIEARKREADGHVYIDYSLHAAITDFSEDVLKNFSKFIEMGIPSFKLFMIYAKEGWMSDDAVMYAILEAARDHGAIVGVHAENPHIIDYNIAKFLREGKVTPPYHGLSRPPFVEAEAINRAIYLTESAKSRLYIFHMTIGEGARLIADARKRGVRVFAETCPHYLMLTDERYEGDDGVNYPTGPPLRTTGDIEALWRSLADGTLQVVATDHCTFTRKQKEMGRHDFTKIPNGLPGVETLMPILYSEGVRKGRLSLNQFIQITSTNPARLFGLHPRKGTLSEGADADVVVWDPEKTIRISPEKLHMNLDFSPYEGLEVTGWPEVTISRGKPIYRSGQFIGDKNWGGFVKRSYVPNQDWDKILDHEKVRVAH